jgi:hypothetical protein
VTVRTGLSAVLAGDEKVMPEKPGAVKLKHVSAQAAIHAQSVAVLFVLSLGAWRWWSQSGIALEADIFVAVATLAAKPVAAGSVATARLTRTAKMVRPMRRVMLYFVTTTNITPRFYGGDMAPSDALRL